LAAHIGGYCASWTVTIPANEQQELAYLPAKFDSLTVKDAFSNGEKRPPTFIDSILSMPSQPFAPADESDRNGLLKS
jgi:hypothetical protein